MLGGKGAPQSPGVYLCASPKLWFELSLSSHPFCLLTGLPGDLIAFSNAQEGLEAAPCPDTLLMQTLRVRLARFWKGECFPLYKESHAVMLVSFEPMNQPCSFSILCHRGN